MIEKKIIELLLNIINHKNIPYKIEKKEIKDYGFYRALWGRRQEIKNKIEEDIIK